MITISILTLIVAKALPALNTHISSIHFTRITSIVFLFSGALSLNSLNLIAIGSGIGIYSGLFQVTSITQTIEIFLFIIGGGILIGWPQIKQGLTELDFSEKAINSSLTLPTNGGLGNNCETTAPLLLTDKHSTDYSLIVLFSSLGSSLLISSYDLISVYLSIELQSFGLYILSTLYRNSESSTSAGLKYFLLGGLSSCIILLGTGIIYSYTGTTNLESLYVLNSALDQLLVDQQSIILGISLGIVLIFVGFLFKIAAAPLHNWSPDVYDGTPTIVTTWLTIIPKISILVLLLELQVKLGKIGGFNTIFVNNNLLTEINSDTINLLLNQDIIKSLVLISAILSLIIGSLLGLAQTRIKRLLAYSTISHIGFILVALAINTEQSIDSFIFYIIQYTITNLNIFLVILGISYISYNSSNIIPSIARGTAVKDISFINELKGFFFNNPLLSISLAISLFSMAGIPPLIGFFSKQFVLFSALQNGYYFISIVAIVVSVISCSYYLQIIKVLFTNKEENSPLANNSNIQKENIILTNTHSFIISTLTFSILLFFIKPSLILNSTQLLSLSLFYI